MSRCDRCYWEQDLLGDGGCICVCGYERVTLSDGEEYILLPVDRCPHWTGKGKRRKAKKEEEAKQ